MSPPLLEVEDLTVTFYTEEGVVRAVDGLSYRVEAGEFFGVVGESGAGKSVASLALMNLVGDPGRVEAEAVRFRGEDVLGMSDRRLRDLRGGEIAMVFQDPQTALNPVYTVGEQVAEAIRVHFDLPEAAVRERAVEMLDRVGIPDPETRYSDHPHQLSGGMQQRVLIATALSCEPALLVADEPTTGLDVTIEAQILELLTDLADEMDVAVQLVTHDLGVVAEVCDRVMVMYAGRAVETAAVEDLYYEPKHPYTAGLMSAIPRVGVDRDRLDTIPGSMPDLLQVPTGCRFHPRCPYAEECCTTTDPPLVDVETGTDLDSAGPDDKAHGAACLAYTGDLSGDLEFEVEVSE